MGGNDINNTNNVQANSAQLAAGNPNGMNGSLQIGSNFLYGDSSNMAVRTPGGFSVQNQNGSSSANINARQVQANYDTTLGTAGGQANAGWGCSPNGSLAANANGSGQLMVCQNGAWTASTGATASPPTLVWSGVLLGSSGITWANMCYVSGAFMRGFRSVYNGYNRYIYPEAGPNAQGQYYWAATGFFDASGIYVDCYDFS